MAKKAEAKPTENVNKSAAIRDLLIKYPGKSPVEIAELMQLHYSIEVKPQYVSTIKSNMLKKAKKKPRRSAITSKRKTTSGEPVSVDSLSVAVELIRSAGSLDGARSALNAVEHIRSL